MILSNDCYLYGNCKKFLNKSCDTQASEFCIKLFKLNYLYDESLLSSKQRLYTALRTDADGTDRDKFIQLKKVEENIEKFVLEGNNLFLHSSNCGNGKTEWAIRMIQAYLSSIWFKSELSCKALFINVPRFLLAIKDNISEKSEYIEHIKKNVLNADIVVWDEVGVKALTVFEHDNLLNLINTRLDYDKCNIYTSNLSAQELREKVGERLYSRIINMSLDIEFFGKDKRGV